MIDSIRSFALSIWGSSEIFSRERFPPKRPMELDALSHIMLKSWYEKYFLPDSSRRESKSPFRKDSPVSLSSIIFASSNVKPGSWIRIRGISLYSSVKALTSLSS